MIVDNVLLVCLLTFWFSTIPVACLTLTRFLRNRKIFIEKNLERIHNDPIIIFQITTRSATKTPVVFRGINSIKESAFKINYKTYHISIVTEDNKDIQTLKKINNCEVIIVDPEFKTTAIKKSRALQYAVEYRRKKNQNNSNFWIFHMDDESFVTDQTILSLLKYIRENKGIAAEGPIFYPLKFELANPITAIAESIRPFSCYDCVSQMTNPPPIHMHGSNLLVRSDVEDKIGWKFGETLAEDQIFGYEIYKKYGPKSMGWHGGILLEQPPLSFKDHFMQRRRWIIGTLQNIQKFPFWHKFKIIFKLFSYFMGFISGIFSITLYLNTVIPKITGLIYSINLDQNADVISNTIILFQQIISTFLPTISTNSIFNNTDINTGDLGIISLFLIFPYIMWLISYQIGLFFNIQYKDFKNRRKILLHMQTLLLSAIIGLVETFPAFITIMEFYVKRIRSKKINNKTHFDFYVINK